ncbi:MAG: gliding motility-associated C-terminal domain-containing protein, partial [Chitinophagaceae bacterium]
TLRVRNANNCISKDSVVTINLAPTSPSLPKVIIQQPTDCANPIGSIIFDNITSLSFSIDGGLTYFNSPIFNNIGLGNYRLRVKNDNGCISKDSIVSISQNNLQINLPLVTISQPQTCDKQMGEIRFGTTANLLFSINNGNSYQNNNLFAELTPGIYILKVKDANNCTSKDSSVTINKALNPPSLPVINGSASLCKFSDANYTIATTGGLWSSSQPSILSINNSGRATALQAGTSIINYKIVYNADCIAETSKQITVNSLNLQLAATPNPVVAGSNLQLNVTSNNNFTVLKWLPENIFANTNTNSTQQIQLFNTTTFRVIAQSSLHNCIDTASITVNIIEASKEVFIPNAFTPNGDGNNDELMVFNNYIASMEWLIYDQYGNIVFQTTDIKGKWNGKKNGKDQPAGVYIYLVRGKTINGESFLKRGSVTLLR